MYCVDRDIYHPLSIQVETIVSTNSYCFSRLCLNGMIHLGNTLKKESTHLEIHKAKKVSLHFLKLIYVCMYTPVPVHACVFVAHIIYTVTYREFSISHLLSQVTSVAQLLVSFVQA